jgi:hypothetical protein
MPEVRFLLGASPTLITSQKALQIRAASPCGGTATQFGGFLDTLGTASGGMGRTLWG